MLNFKFDAAWLLLPANIYHEIRKKKWKTLSNKICSISQKNEHEFYAETEIIGFPFSFNTSHSKRVLQWLSLPNLFQVKCARSSWHRRRSYELCVFIVNPRRIHLSIIGCPQHTHFNTFQKKLFSFTRIHHAKLVNPHNFHFPL